MNAAILILKNKEKFPSNKRHFKLNILSTLNTSTKQKIQKLLCISPDEVIAPPCIKPHKRNRKKSGSCRVIISHRYHFHRSIALTFIEKLEAIPAISHSNCHKKSLWRFNEQWDKYIAIRKTKIIWNTM